MKDEINLWINDNQLDVLEKFLGNIELPCPAVVNVRLVSTPGELYKKYDTEVILGKNKTVFGFNIKGDKND